MRFKGLIRRKDGQNVILIPPVEYSVLDVFLRDLYDTVEETALSDKNSFYWISNSFYHNEVRQI